MKKPNPTAAASLEGIDFQDLLHVLLGKAWLIALCAVLGGALGALYVKNSIRIFASREVIQVEEAQRVLNIEQVSSEDVRSSEIIKTIEQNLVSATLLERVAKANHLPYTGAQLALKVTAKIRQGTRLIDIVAEDPHPQAAQQIAQSVVKEFILQNLETRSGSAQVASEFLEDEAKRLKARLEKSEQALQSYKETNQAVSLEDRQNITIEKLKDLNQRETEAKTERLRLEADYAAVQRANGDIKQLSTITSVASNTGLIEFKKLVAAQAEETATLSERYRAKHPKLILARRQLENLQGQLPAEIRKAASMVESAFETAKSTEAKFEEALRDQERVALELNKLAIPYNVLAREVESDRALFESVLKRLKETDVTRGIEQNNVRVIENAELPALPVRPDKLKVMLLAVAGGLAAGLGLALGINALDSSFKTVDQAEKGLGMPILAAVPRFSGPTDMVFSEPGSAAAESFRSLRTALSLLGRAEDRKVILFTSAAPSEGKSFCAMNYAVSLAQQGLRTLIIDADLRMPTMASHLLHETGQQGLTELLAGASPFDTVIHPTNEERLFVLPAGNRPPNPTELLARADLSAVLGQAVKQFDRIVIDTAPLNVVSDTLLLIEHANSVCLVVQASRTPRKAVMRSLATLSSAGHQPTGLILNRLTLRTGAGYYYHYSSKYGVPAKSAKPATV